MDDRRRLVLSQRREQNDFQTRSIKTEGTLSLHHDTASFFQAAGVSSVHTPTAGRNIVGNCRLANLFGASYRKARLLVIGWMKTDPGSIMSPRYFFGFLALPLVLAASSCAPDSGHRVADYRQTVKLVLSADKHTHAAPSPGTPSFLPDGHHDTTSVVAAIAGLGDDVPHRLAYFSQAPDNLWLPYSAPSVAVWGSFWPTFYRHRIVNILHSLHGGGPAEVKARRQALHDLIRSSDKTKPEEQWKIGFLIHAMGDSYAHVRPTAPGPVAYGEFVGHGFDNCVKPDMIYLHVENYIDYVESLYHALEIMSPEGDAPARKAKLKNFCDAIRDAAELPGDTDEAREKHIKDAICKFNEGIRYTDEEVNEEWNAEIKGVSRFLGDVEKRL